MRSLLHLGKRQLFTTLQNSLVSMILPHLQPTRRAPALDVLTAPRQTHPARTAPGDPNPPRKGSRRRRGRKRGGATKWDPTFIIRVMLKNCVINGKFRSFLLSPFAAFNQSSPAAAPSLPFGERPDQQPLPPPPRHPLGQQDLRLRSDSSGGDGGETWVAAASAGGRPRSPPARSGAGSRGCPPLPAPPPRPGRAGQGAAAAAAAAAAAEAGDGATSSAATFLTSSEALNSSVSAEEEDGLAPASRGGEGTGCTE